MKLSANNYEHTEIDKKLALNRFLAAGVYPEKIYITDNSSVAIWNVEKKRLSNHDTDIETNRVVSLSNYTELLETDIMKINSSEGIIVSYATYGKPYYRYCIVPNI